MDYQYQPDFNYMYTDDVCYCCGVNSGKERFPIAFTDHVFPV